ncbi:OmpA family protein [Hymenobacter antarcticus]
MKNKLVEPVDFHFTGDVVTHLGTLVDETALGVEKALSIAVPLVLSGLAARVGQDLTAQGLLDIVREAEQKDVLKQLSDGNIIELNAHEWNSNLLLDLLGSNYRSTVNQIAVQAAIRPTASSTLLQVAIVAVVGVLGRFAAENEFAATDFVYWLRIQKGSIGAAMLPPPGAGASQAANQSYPGRPPGAATQRATGPAGASVWSDPDYTPPAPDEPLGLRWKWGILLLLAACLGYFFGRGLLGSSSRPAGPTALGTSRPRQTTSLDASLLAPDAAPTPAEPRAVTPTPVAPAPPATPAAGPSADPAKAVRAARTATAPAVSAAVRPARTWPAAGGDSPGRYDQDRDTYIYDTGRPITLTLADGTTQKVGANSTENRLYTFLASPEVQVDSVNRTKGWINFDRINFETGKALLTPESALQLGNIASILNTFPRAIVKIGGYTDSTGEALVNYQLSEDRARAAMLTLAGMDVSADRLQAKGYGPKYFVRPNNTPAGRALNRRVSIRVVHK